MSTTYDTLPSVHWYGQSGQHYLTLALRADSKFPDLPGVYSMARLERDGNFTALYVGESESLDSRLTRCLFTHHAYASALIFGMTHICIVHVPGRVEGRLAVETDLRRALNPIVNRQ